MNRLGKRLPPLATLLPFEAAARFESFSLAARELHVTQAAVSRQVRALERDLDCALFERRNRAVFLTTAGRELARVVRAALEGVAEGAQALRASASRHEVVLFCQLCEAFHWLMPRLSAFHSLHPEIELRVVTSTRPISEWTEHFDLAIQRFGRPSADHVLRCTAADNVFPVCSPAYLAGRPGVRSVHALGGHRLLHQQVACADWMTWAQWFDAVGAKIVVGRSALAFDTYSLALQAAIEGQGIVLGWQSTVARLLEQGALVRPLRESVHEPRSLCLYARQGGEGALIEKACRWLMTQLRGMDEPRPAQGGAVGTPDA